MKHVIIPILSWLVISAASAQIPNFDYPRFLTNESGYIVSANNYTCPCFGDWDDDGDQDMMVGVFYNGNIQYYENISTGIEPVFASHTLLSTVLWPITVSYG